MSSSTLILKKLRKDFGDSSIRLGDAPWVEVPRLPTGIFPLDLIIGGGLPMGRLTLIYGVESSLKTNLFYKAVAVGQKQYPGKMAVLIDVEHAYDPKWAGMMGVDTSRLFVCSPESAEEAIDVTQAFLYADDVFAVCVDSLAALVTTNEIESSSEKMAVGGSSLIIGKLIRKIAVSFTVLRNKGILPPALIAINQIRYKIGGYGAPESLPGGNSQRYASTLSIRLYGKDILDKKVNPVMPAYKEVNVVIKKWKVPINAINAVFRMQTLHTSDGKPGDVEDWRTLKAYLTDLDYLSKDSKGWVLFGEKFQTLEAAKQSLYSDPERLIEAQQQIIKECLAKGGLSPQEDDDGEEDGTDQESILESGI